MTAAMTAANPSPGAPSVLVCIPRDAAALSVGADATARAIAEEASRRGLSLQIRRTGSRGMFWLEPLVEVERDGKRHAYGPVGAGDVPALIDALFPEPSAGVSRSSPDRGPRHPLDLGPVDSLPFLAAQTRITFARCGVIDPLSLDEYRAHGGGKGLETALALGPEASVAAIVASGLRGRGGAGFPTGIKWKTVMEAEADRKYVVCNADEGDSGTFADRMLMEGDPFTLIEGMAIAAVVTGASAGMIYLRSEYPHAIRTMKAALELATLGGLIGADVMGSGKPFFLEVRTGAGAYICGEETAMLESLEGRRGMVRAKPPIPALHGLFGRPTVVNNVLSFAAVPSILAEGGEAYAAHGIGRSRGTQPFQLAGNVRHGGLFEAPFGLSIEELVCDIGGGSRSGRPVRSVQIGGPLGAYLPRSLFHLPLGYEELAEAGAMLGHGGVVVFDDTVDMAAQARFAMAFCALESCGKCTPCRIGSTRGVEVIDRLRQGLEPERNRALLDDLCEAMADGSLCALGGLTPMPVRSALTHFPDDFGAR